MLGIEFEFFFYIVECLFNEFSVKIMDDLYVEIGIGICMVLLVVCYIMIMMDIGVSVLQLDLEGYMLFNKLDLVVIIGSEGVLV